MKTHETLPLLDFMRPLERHGALLSVLASTYALSLSDPPFFEQDFLPTLLGLGGVRARGYSSPANLERGLGEIYCGLVCDAHALAEGGRPSLRVDVIPVGHQLYHAKVVLIHHERSVRLVISSANLTHEGFHRNREAAVVLDFHERTELQSIILENFALQWLARIGSTTTTDFRRALDEAVSAAKVWKPTRSGKPNVITLWGGGDVPLWQQFIQAWPQGEALRDWQICSPFWPGPGDTDTPFDVFRRELDARGANVAGAKLTLFARADAPGVRGRPFFPFQLVEQLAKRGFRPVDGTICPVRLDALEAEIPDGKAEDQRPLHAKWIFLRGEHTVLLLLGSMNFTRRGLGVYPAKANAEVCVLLSGSPNELSIESIVPPITEEGIVQWRDCRGRLATPLPEIEPVLWPAFITAIELEVFWEPLPISGTLRICCSTTDQFSFSIAWEKGEELVPLPLVVGEPSPERGYTAQLGEIETYALLVRRRVVVFWGESLKTFFPINIASASKPGLPAVLGQDPTEQELIQYFRGEIRPESSPPGPEPPGPTPPTPPVPPLPPGRELQNYVMRDFLEALYGMEELLRDSDYSQRVFEQALLGEFSPVRLANETQRAFVAERRTATATGFQLFELLRLVENLSPREQKQRSPAWFADTRDRAVEQLLCAVRAASVHPRFRESCSAAPFQKLVTALLKPNTADRWRAAIKQL